MGWVRTRATVLLIAIAAGCGAHAPSEPASFARQMEESRGREARGKHDEALHAARLALERARVDPGPSRRHLEDALQAVAREQLALERFNEAVASLNEALPIVVANHGPAGAPVRTVLQDLSSAYFQLHKVDVARQRLQEAIDIMEADKARDDGELAELLNTMGWMHLYLGDYDPGKAVIRRAIEIAERLHRPGAVAKYLRTQARAFSVTGARREAEAVVRRALKIDESIDPQSLRVADDEDALGDILLGDQRFDEALAHYQVSLAILESKLKPSDPGYLRLPNTVLKVANVFGAVRDWDRSFALYEQAIAMHKRLGGENSLEAALATVILVNVYMLKGDYDAALPRLESAVAIMRSIGVPRNVLRPALDTQAKILFKLNTPGFRAMARQLYEQLAEEDRRAGDLISYGRMLSGLGLACMAIDDRDCAIHALKELVECETKVRPRTSFAIRSSHALLALAHYAFHEYDEAIDENSLALDTAIEQGSTLDEAQHLDMDLQSYLDALWRASRPPKTGGRSRAATGFMVLQRDQQSRAALALARMAARTAAGKGDLSDLVRRDQDLRGARASLERAFAEALSSSETAERTASVDRVRARIAATDGQQRAVRAELAKHTAYQALTAPPVVPPEALQEKLQKGELLLAFNFSRHGGFVWALDHDELTWTKVDLTAAQLETEVRALRDGLDFRGATRGMLLARSGGPVPTFDRDRSYRLYQTLFARLADRIRPATHLFVVPSGGLESLPLGVLITRDPTGTARTFDSYRDTAWLIREKAIMVLPSVSALASLRGPEGAAASKAFLGIGNPTLSEKEKEASLKPLPAAEDELRRIAAAAGTGGADVYVGDRATEDALKALKLDDYRVISFATHGLTARETRALQGLTEPALVLSTPRPGDHEDGFLTASEVADLRLRADWVVLSACNTAAGDGAPREETLSGLARAFFYAGARALLASHWSVYSSAAAELTTKTFAELRRAPSLGRAEALRRATVAVMNEPFKSDPAYWGPFSFVGDGGAARGR